MTAKRITHAEENAIVRELERWRDGELGSKLTWEKLEENTGFSRQALSDNTRIKAAYDSAKRSLRGGLVKTRQKQNDEVVELQRELETLKTTLDEYKVREQQWQRRWQRIAYHLRAKGISVGEVDREAPTDDLPSKRESNNVLRPFDQPLPPSGRE